MLANASPPPAPSPPFPPHPHPTPHPPPLPIPPPPLREFKTWTTIYEQYGPFEAASTPPMRSDDAKYDPPPVDLGTNLNVDLVYEVSKLVNKSLRIDAIQYSRASK